MPVGLRQDIYQPSFQKRKPEPSQTVVGLADLDNIPGVDTVNNTISDLANEGKIKNRKILNIIMTCGLGVAAFFTGKRITKSVMDSIAHHTIYLNPLANVVKNGFYACSKPIENLNPEKGGKFFGSIKKGLKTIPQKLKNYARTGIHKDIELEKYANDLGVTDVKKLSEIDLARFELKYCNTLVKNGISKLIATSLGLVTGVETFIEVGADKNKNGIPDLFEQKNYKQIIEIAQPKFDEKVIEQARKINNEDDDNNKIAKNN